MTRFRLTCAALTLLLLATGAKTRPIEIAKERFERLKPPVTISLASNA